MEIAATVIGRPRIPPGQFFVLPGLLIGRLADRLDVVYVGLREDKPARDVGREAAGCHSSGMGPRLGGTLV